MTLQSIFNRHYIKYFVKENRSWMRWKNLFILIRMGFVVSKKEYGSFFDRRFA